MSQTCVSSSKYTQHLLKSSVKLELNDIHCMPQHSLDCTHQNVLLPTSCSLVPSYWKRGFSVILPMWYDLHVSSDSKSSESKRSICMEFLHAYIPIDMVRMSQSFQKTSESKDPSTWSFFMRFIPIWLKWQCHKYVVLSLLFYIFWHEHVYHYDRDSINHSF